MQEFDVIKYATLSVVGSFIEYTAINNAEGALRLGADEIQIRGDGVLVGKLRPGETLNLGKTVKRWEIYATNYARVRIGTGSAGFVAQRGITQTDRAINALRGTEWVISTKSPSTAGMFNYCGIANTSTDKLMAVVLTHLYTSSASSDHMLTMAQFPGAVPATSDQCMNRHPAVAPADWLVAVSGNTVALTPAAGEFSVASEVTEYFSVAGTRSQTTGIEGAPWIIPPGYALLHRMNLAGQFIAVQYWLKSMSYGPQ